MGFRKFNSNFKSLLKKIWTRVYNFLRKTPSKPIDAVDSYDLKTTTAWNAENAQRWLKDCENDLAGEFVKIYYWKQVDKFLEELKTDIRLGKNIDDYYLDNYSYSFEKC